MGVVVACHIAWLYQTLHPPDSPSHPLHERVAHVVARRGVDRGGAGPRHEVLQDKLDIAIVLVSLIPAAVEWWRHHHDRNPSATELEKGTPLLNTSRSAAPFNGWRPGWRRIR